MSQLLLAVDTSGKNGSVALARVSPGHSEVEIIEAVPLAGGTFSAQLVPQISALLAKHGYTKSDLASFAAVSGPGSFTGLRVGLAAIKALAEVLEKPIAAISLLEAVACSSPALSRTSVGRPPGPPDSALFAGWGGSFLPASVGRPPESPDSMGAPSLQRSLRQGWVLAALDAGRGEVYVGDYERDDQKRGDNDTVEPDPGLRMNSERLLTRAAFLAEAQGKSVVTPDAAVAEMLSAAAIPCEQIDYPSSAVIARLGWGRIQRDETVRPEDLEANYIRRSDAEIFSQPKP